MLVQASGLVKQYPRVRALDQVSLEIKEGEVFGLFGPNGAGKTTCLRVLSGLTQPDQGSATVCGIDIRAAPNEVRRELGMLISPTALGAIFLLLSILTTETGLTFLGTQVAFLMRPSGRGFTIADFEAIRNIAQSLSVFSPHHVGARILAIAFGITGLWADIHVIVPLAALILAGGYLFGKKLYLDVFIR